MQIQENLQSKLEIDASRLVTLANTLEENNQGTYFEISWRVDVALVMLKWWKSDVRRDLKMLEQESKIKCVNMEKQEGVFKSIEGMKGRMEDAVNILTCTLNIIDIPEPLLCICLQKLEGEKLYL